MVGFVQNSNSKAVHQSGVGSEEPFEALFDVDATPAGITNLTSTTCLSKFSPEVTIANFGANNLTSMDIYYSVNGGDEQMYSWSGNVAYLSLSNVLLPEIEYDLMEENQLKVYFSNTNGTGDEYPANDTLYFNFDRSIVVPESVSLIIKLDNNPEETTWEIINADDEIVFEGGPYTTPNGFISLSLEFEVTDCYKFTIYDAGENGISLPGFFSLFKGSTQILTGSNFGAEASQMFLGEAPVGTIEVAMDVDVNVYPNPVLGSGIISFFLPQQSEVQIDITNQLGQKINTISNKVLMAGKHDIPFGTEDIPQGFYFVNVKIGAENNIHKISVIK